MEAKAISQDAVGTAHTKTSQPREGFGRAASTQSVPQKNKVFLIRTAEGRRHRVTSSSNTLRVLPVPAPDGGFFNTVKALDGGVWDTIMTSPYGFEIAIVSEDEA